MYADTRPLFGLVRPGPRQPGPSRSSSGVPAGLAFPYGAGGRHTDVGAKGDMGVVPLPLVEQMLEQAAEATTKRPCLHARGLHAQV